MRTKMLTDAEKESLYQQIRQGVPGAYAKLVLAYELFLIKKAGVLRREYGLPENVNEDIVQLLLCTAFQAEKNYDPDRGSLPTFLVFILRNAVKKFRAENQFAMRIPELVLRRRRNLSQAVVRLKSEASAVTSDELTLATGYTFKEVDKFLNGFNAVSETISIFEPINSGTFDSAPLTLADELVSSMPPIVEEISAKQIQTLLREAVQALPKREAEIIRRRALSLEPDSLDVLGQHFHLSKERVRQIELSALKSIRVKLAKRGIRSFADTAGT